ncbi:hypothetical protein J437_LFUL006588 [Ladona fulva]|uniref:Uncharacterized protein n=1 Tax=Ladona fulva TaxID=123851 RepID=A0A8K0NZ72_LADFU|nr:hypothetical protein J437_LFUL006588 [Ladona fulva]
MLIVRLPAAPLPLQSPAPSCFSSIELGNLDVLKMGIGGGESWGRAGCYDSDVLALFFRHPSFGRQPLERRKF